MEMTSGTGLHGRPWPELTPDRRPVLVVPAFPGRLMILDDGWSHHATDPRPAWSAVLDGHRLTLLRPGGQTWYDGEITTTHEWRRAVRAHTTLLLITGPFTSPHDLRTAATSGRLLLLTTPIHLTHNP